MTTKIIVPCGRCSECVASRKSDLYIRSFFETLRCLKNGGYMFFETLTYNDYHLPVKSFKVNDYWKKPSEPLRMYMRENRSQVQLPYPNYDDVVSFWHRLRKNVFSLMCKRESVTQRSSRGEELRQSVSNNLKYICCTQFGEKGHRPHYHFCLWVNVPINQYELKCMINKAWRNESRLIPDSFRHFVFNIKDFGMTDVTFAPPKTKKPTTALRNIDFNTIKSFDLQAIGYITRYVVRDVDSDKYHCDLLNIKNPFDLPKELRGQIKCSSNLGYDVFKNYSDYSEYLKIYHIKIDFDNLKITIPSKDKKDTSGFVTLAIPQYYKRKFFYANTAIWNENNEKSYVQLPREPWQMEVSDLKSPYDSKVLTFADSIKKQSDYLYKQYLACPQSVKDSFDEFSHGVDFEDLALYKSLIYGKVYSKDIIDNSFTGDNMTDYNNLLYNINLPNIPIKQYSDTQHLDDDIIELLDYNFQAQRLCFPNYDSLLEMLLTSDKTIYKIKNARSEFIRACDNTLKKYI